MVLQSSVADDYYNYRLRIRGMKRIFQISLNMKQGDKLNVVLFLMLGITIVSQTLRETIFTCREKLQFRISSIHFTGCRIDRCSLYNITSLSLPLYLISNLYYRKSIQAKKIIRSKVFWLTFYQESKWLRRISYT